ncbi:hypothetical protein BC827DRAFT_1252856 [Russula dissimulans]|nr:hypothetical protein BC827DRAFT_1252856 [Russula dissimulans]
MDKSPAGFLSLLWGNHQSQMYSASQWDALSPQPVPENLCQVKAIVADIYRAVERSHVPDQVKANLKQCTHQLEAECLKSTNLTQLVHRAANNSENVLLSRIRFLDALEDRISELSQSRTKFIDSRRTFRDEPNRLLTEGIRDARHHVHDGMLSELSPPFKDIDTYYSEINVSLYVEEECLEKIRRSFRVTPDDKRRWEYIRNACREASDLLTSETLPPSPSTPPNTPQSAVNIFPCRLSHPNRKPNVFIVFS